MDTNKDGYISDDELRNWLKHVASRYVEQDVRRTFDEYTRGTNNDFVTFEQHKQKLSDEFEDDGESDGMFFPNLLSITFVYKII